MANNRLGNNDDMNNEYEKILKRFNDTKEAVLEISTNKGKLLINEEYPKKFLRNKAHDVRLKHENGLLVAKSSDTHKTMNWHEITAMDLTINEHGLKSLDDATQVEILYEKLREIVDSYESRNDFVIKIGDKLYHDFEIGLLPPNQNGAEYFEALLSISKENKGGVKYGF